MATTADAEELHHDALIIDGLIWDLDGDTSELKAANVAAINFTVQSKVIEGGFAECCDDIARWLAYVDAHADEWKLVLLADDILKARAAGQIGIIMGWQNARAIEDNLDRLLLLQRLGLRIMQPTYNYRTFLADGCLELNDGGLSALGREAIRRMNELGIAVDMSHSSDRSTIMAAETSNMPILITHTGASAINGWQRNRSDEAIKAVAETGGIIGVSLYGPIIWNGDTRARPTLDDYRRHIDHVVDLVGIEHVGMGTDQYQSTDRVRYCDGLNTAQDDINPAAAAYSAAFGHTYFNRYPTDCETIADYPAITAILLGAGWSEQHVRAFLGENFLRAFRTIWYG